MRDVQSMVVALTTQPSEHLASKLLSVVRSGSCGQIYAQKTECQTCMRSCSLPGLPRHLVQELNVDIVPLGQYHLCIIYFISCLCSYVSVHVCLFSFVHTL